MGVEKEKGREENEPKRGNGKGERIKVKGRGVK